MTDPSEVKISDAELLLAYRKTHPADQDLAPNPTDLVRLRQALSAFLARRVPDARGALTSWGTPADGYEFNEGHNACRAHILMGDTQ
jgi:hypothetical protein